MITSILLDEPEIRVIISDKLGFCEKAVNSMILLKEIISKLPISHIIQKANVRAIGSCVGVVFI